jgi:hypothetical protein
MQMQLDSFAMAGFSPMLILQYLQLVGGVTPAFHMETQ